MVYRDNLQKQAQISEGRVATLSTDLATTQTNLRHFQQQLEQAAKALETANHKLDHLQDDNRLLGQEKSVLEGRLKQLQQAL